MKKIFFASFMCCLYSATLVYAETASLTPGDSSGLPLGDFSVMVAIDTGGVADYAEKVEIDYPSDLVSIKSFSFSPKWVALTASGYEVDDKAQGIFIKTAGYPGGFATSTSWGTIVFHSKREGEGVIRIGTNSRSFEVDKQVSLGGDPLPVSVLPAFTDSQKILPEKSIPQGEVLGASTEAAPETASFTLLEKAGIAAIAIIVVEMLIGAWWLARKRGIKRLLDKEAKEKSEGASPHLQ
jgi:hypothetical protein